MIMQSDNTPGSLEEQAVKRRQKLLALKRKREGKSDSTEPNAKQPHENEQDVLPKPIFRSYKPSDENLQDNIITDTGPEDITEHVKDQLESAKSQIVMDVLDVTTLAPRTPDWDLKRDIAKKMEKLERRTQRAIAELIRERLNKREEDLAAIVNAAAEIVED